MTVPLAASAAAEVLTQMILGYGSLPAPTGPEAARNNAGLIWDAWVEGRVPMEAALADSVAVLRVLRPEFEGVLRLAITHAQTRQSSVLTGWLMGSIPADHLSPEKLVQVINRPAVTMFNMLRAAMVELLAARLCANAGITYRTVAQEAAAQRVAERVVAVD
jgi:hypothetical protein